MSEEGIKLGIAPINWCNDDMPELGSDISLDQCLSEMQEAGYSATELGHKFPTEADILKPLLGNYKLALASSWYSTYFVEKHNHAEQLEKLECKLKFLFEMGTHVINLAECSGTVHNKKNSPLSSRPTFDDAGWDRLVDGLNKVGKLCRRYGIRAAFHHHMGTGVQTAEEIDRLLSQTEMETVFLCADTGHMQFSGFDPYPVFEKHMDRIAHIHLKDLRENVFNEMLSTDASFLNSILEGIFTVPGDGMIDFTPIFNLINESGYKGWMIVEAEQDPSNFNPLHYAKKARRYIRETANL